jgi:ACS family hexuronate transporter-like MFS transporter
MSFIIIGALGFVWAGLWLFLYNKPTECQYVSKEELAYINSDNDSTEKPQNDYTA